MPYCTDCGKPLKYFDQHKRWYCDSCKRYQNPPVMQYRPVRIPKVVTKKFGKELKRFMLLLVISLILVCLSIVMPWYHFELKEEYSTDQQTTNAKGELDFSIEGTVYNMDFPEESQYEDTNQKNDWEDTNLDETAKTFSNLYYFLIMIAILLLINIFFLVLWKERYISFNVCIFCAVLGLIIIIMVPIYFAIACPAAFYEDTGGDLYLTDETTISYSGFIGSDRESIYSVYTGNIIISATWGPTIGWFLSIVVIIIYGIGFSYLNKFRKRLLRPAKADKVEFIELFDDDTRAGESSTADYECPLCNKKIDPDVTECPSCGVKFEGEIIVRD